MIDVSSSADFGDATAEMEAEPNSEGNTTGAISMGIMASGETALPAALELTWAEVSAVMKTEEIRGARSRAEDSEESIGGCARARVESEELRKRELYVRKMVLDRFGKTLTKK